MRDIRIPFDRGEAEALEKAKKKLAPLGATVRDASVFRRSLDARRTDAIRFVYTVCVDVEGSYSSRRLAPLGAAPLCEPILSVAYGQQTLSARPVIVGFGPCGMFCALLLAEHGYRPIVLERGDSAGDRVEAVRRFVEQGTLDPDSNIQFGAGGAGTFSDGKLTTRIGDPFCRYILKRLHEFGAPADILVNARPHIGTDLLPGIVDRIAARITECGGQILFRTRFCGLRADSAGRITAVCTEHTEIPCGVVVPAIGHSARDTYDVLERHGIRMEAKPFSVGVRIEHLQADIDRSLYGKHAGHPALPPGEYQLSTRVHGRGVYSFCMCPGGTVAAAASEQGGVVTNGMSENARDGVNANSAIAVSVFPEDYGGSVCGAIDFVRAVERAAFTAGGGDFCAPVQTVGDFLAHRMGTEPGRVLPTYRQGSVKVADLSAVLPDFVAQALRAGLTDFARRLPAFANADAVLTGAETRTSAPVRIPRDEAGLSPAFSNLYPCGEGAGYAGGITSASVDGVRCALKIMERYAK